MALGNFLNCLPVTLKYEGGWSDHRRDPGGATMKGITLAVYRQHRPNATKYDLKFIKPSEVETIYRSGYWAPIRGDDLPAGIDLAVFDFGVNSGPARAARHLQAAVGVEQDGKIGPATLKAVKAANGKEVIQRLCGRRLSFVRSLRTFATFGKGWSRRIADVEATAVAMFLTAGAPMTAEAKRELIAEADQAQAQAVQSSQKSASTTIAGTAAGGVDAAMNGGPNWLLLGLLVGVVLTAAAVMVMRSRLHRDRAEAYAALAAA